MNGLLRSMVCLASALSISGCDGGGHAAPLPQPSDPVVFSQSSGLSAKPQTLTFTVHADGSVTYAVGAQVRIAKLSSGQTAQLYTDIQRAMPLSALPLSGPADLPSLTVSWKGETSPDIFGGSPGIENALLTDYGNAYALFSP